MSFYIHCIQTVYFLHNGILYSHIHIKSLKTFERVSSCNLFVQMLPHLEDHVPLLLTDQLVLVFLGKLSHGEVQLQLCQVKFLTWVI